MGRRLPRQVFTAAEVDAILAQPDVDDPIGLRDRAHTMATQMLDRGADIRFVQDQLGHAELSTTAIYTQVSIRALEAVHSRTHPTESSAR